MDAAKEGIDRIGQLTWHPGEALPQKFLENLSIPESGVVTWVAVQHEHLQQQGTAMEYLIINHSVEVDGPAPGTPEFGAMMGQWMAYNQMLIDNGHWIGGASLTPSAAATSVAKSGDAVKITDGPFAETKEQIGGYYVIKADDLDEAIRLAQAMPADDVVFEIRPIAFRPDA